MRSALSLFAPMLTPTTPGLLRRAASRRSAASWPSLLKPSRLITASSLVSRKIRGLGLPDCGSGVTVPASAKPKPSESNASGTSAFLSYPAAKPSGLGKSIPATRTFKRGSERRLETIGRPHLRAVIESACAVSGSSVNSACRASRSRRPITLEAPERHGRRRCRAAVAWSRAPHTSRGARRDAETARRRAIPRISAPHRVFPAPRPPATDPPARQNALPAVSRTWAAVDKWMKPSARSIGAPAKLPVRSASRQSSSVHILYMVFGMRGL